MGKSIINNILLYYIDRSILSSLTNYKSNYKISYLYGEINELPELTPKNLGLWCFPDKFNNNCEFNETELIYFTMLGLNYETIYCSCFITYEKIYVLDDTEKQHCIITPKKTMVELLSDPIGSYNKYKMLYIPRSLIIISENPIFNIHDKLIMTKTIKMSGVDQKIFINNKTEYFDMSIFLNRVSIENSVELFMSILMEKKILIFSKNPSDIVLYVESLFYFLHPIKWCCAYIPNLPIQLWEMLYSLIPFIIGMSSEHKHFIKKNIDTYDFIIFNMDDNTIENKNIKSESTEYYYNFLINKLKDQHSKLKDQYVAKNYNIQVSMTSELITDIKHIFSECIMMMINKIYYKVDPKKDDFADFVISETMMFNQYLNELSEKKYGVTKKKYDYKEKKYDYKEKKYDDIDITIKMEQKYDIIELTSKDVHIAESVCSYVKTMMNGVKKMVINAIYNKSSEQSKKHAIVNNQTVKYKINNELVIKINNCLKLKCFIF